MLAIFGCSLLLAHFQLHAQTDVPEGGSTFQSGVVLGFNASQLDGDGLAGYNKLGLVAGLSGGFYISENWNIRLEMLFSQKGSKIRDNKITQGDVPFRIHLNFLEVPLAVSYDFGSWAAEGGLTYARLIGAKTEASALTKNDFKQNDFGFLLGIGYRFDESWGASARFSRSLTDIVNHSALNTNGLYGHLFSLRANYYF